MPNNSPTYRTSLPFELLKSFTQQELKNFEKLVDSGYLSTKQGLNKLLKSLRKHALDHLDFTPVIQCAVYNDLFENEKAIGLLNNNQKKKLSKIMNELLRVAAKFLMFERIKDTDEYDATILFPELVDRKQLMLYRKQLKAAEKKLNEVKKQGYKYHNQCYLIQKEKGHLLFINNALGKEDNYDVLQYHADLRYLLEKLNYHLSKITLQNRYPNKKFDFTPYLAIESLFKLSQYKQTPLIQLYLLNIDLVQKVDDKTYDLLFNALRHYQELIPASFLRIFYTNLNNYCSFQYIKGNLKYLKKLLSNYKLMHKNNLLVNDQKVDIAVLKNVVTVACSLKDFYWASKMLRENIDYVFSDVRDCVFHYNKGIIEFNMESYNKALDYFKKVKKIDEFHITDLKATLLQCFYETDKNYEDYTQQMIDTFRFFLSTTKKLKGPQSTSYKNFIFFFGKLYSLKKIFNRRERCLKIKKILPVLIQQITNKQFIRNREWLLSKAKALLDDCTK